MAYQLYVRPEAESDLADTYAFYQECRLGLGDDFMLCAEEALERVLKNPFGVEKMSTPQYTFAVKAISQNLVWGLKGADDNWAICEFNDGEFDAMLLWAEEKAAKACAVGEWSGYKPASIDLKSYVDSWLPAMKEDNIKIVIGFGPRSHGSVFESDELATAIRAARGGQPTGAA